ncbi:Rha family transcriptional regulator, partial [Geobacillus sp. MR]|uniref:Rha family transcriptional regulator n=1 Tax=Geobacillus sp. MR TaxID=2508875 RepID=UPI001C0E98C1
MSTNEIADLSGKRHDHVMRDARKMLVELHGEDDLPKFGGVYRGANGEDRPCLHLPKRETLILVSGYNLKMRAAIIDRWQELEARPAADPIAMLSDPAAMRGILLSYTEKVLELQGEVEEMRPQVQALE